MLLLCAATRTSAPHAAADDAVGFFFFCIELNMTTVFPFFFFFFFFFIIVVAAAALLSSLVVNCGGAMLSGNASRPRIPPPSWLRSSRVRGSSDFSDDVADGPSSELTFFSGGEKEGASRFRFPRFVGVVINFVSCLLRSNEANVIAPPGSITPAVRERERA